MRLPFAALLLLAAAAANSAAATAAATAAAASSDPGRSLPCPFPPCAQCKEALGPRTNFSDFYLPDLMVAADGSTIATAAQWETKRAQLKEQLQLHMFGHVPKTVPTIVNAVRTASYSDASRGLVDEMWAVTFRTNATFTVTATFELIIPNRSQLLTVGAAGEKPGEKKLPLFVSEGTHRSWAMGAVNRGFAAMLTPTNDANDATGFKLAYPGATWGDIIRRAWTVSRFTDFVLDPSWNPHAGLLDSAQLAFVGHSRNGKQAELLGAFDERYAAIVGSSPSTPTVRRLRGSRWWCTGCIKTL